MKMLLRILFFLFTLLLLIACLVACFTNTPIEDISTQLSLTSLLQNFETLNNSNVLIDKLSNLSNSLENPIPDVPVLGGLLNFLISVFKVIIFCANALLILIDFLISCFTLLFSFI